VSEIRVGVRDLKARLSEYLRLVKSGHTVIITEHGRPVGHLSPVEQPLEARLKALQDAGLISWNGKKLNPVSIVAINQSNKLVSDLVSEMRD
jgi:prevent-host-death family protein